MHQKPFFKNIASKHAKKSISIITSQNLRKNLRFLPLFPVFVIISVDFFWFVTTELHFEQKFKNVLAFVASQSHNVIKINFWVG